MYSCCKWTIYNALRVPATRTAFAVLCSSVGWYYYYTVLRIYTCLSVTSCQFTFIINIIIILLYTFTSIKFTVQWLFRQLIALMMHKSIWYNQKSFAQRWHFHQELCKMCKCFSDSPNNNNILYIKFDQTYPSNNNIFTSKNFVMREMMCISLLNWKMRIYIYGLHMSLTKDTPVKREIVG